MKKSANNSELMHKAKYYTCKRLRLLAYLKEKGFKPFKTIPDANNTNYNWWLFENTPELERALDHYFNKNTTFDKALRTLINLKV